MRSHSTNSPLVVLVLFAVGIAAALVGGLPAVAWYVAGFLIGGIGTAINVMRAQRRGAFNA